ncbi:MAG: nucleotidyltransferase family protein, partial [Clostridia bacterium]|nr:nucleotidyltransferase family protein [Clostridia bacterium]
MKIAVITAEYNPLHNGHLYHIEKTRQSFPDHFLVVVMSGSFVMRGEP